MSAAEMRDAVADRKQGIREGSARDVAIDRMKGVSTAEEKKGGAAQGKPKRKGY